MRRAHREDARRIADELVSEFTRVPLEELRRRALIGDSAPGPLVVERAGAATDGTYLCAVAFVPDDPPRLTVSVSVASDEDVRALKGPARRMLAMTRRHGLLWMRPVVRVVSL